MNATTMPKTVSGVITAYDRPAFLREAIESALVQTRPLLELIVVDDSSPSDLAVVVAPFGERVRYLRLAHNQGANAARNAGIAAASGDAVAFLDDDDLWEPKKIERQLVPLQEGHDAVLCGWWYVDRAEPRVQPVAEVTAAMLRAGNAFCGTSGLLARRQLLLDEPFDPTLPQGQEWDVFVRLAQRRPLANVREPLYRRRYSGHEGITSSARRKTPEELLECAAVLRKHRGWLGERWYREHLAARLLAYVRQRPAKHRYVLEALRHAGPLATARFLLRETFRSRRYRTSRSSAE